MHRAQRLWPLLFLALILAACRPQGQSPAPTLAAPTTQAAPTDTAAATFTDLPPTLAPTQVEPTDTSAPLPSPTLQPSPTTEPPTAAPSRASEAPAELSLVASNVVLYPVPTIYAGDKVTFQVLPGVPESIEVTSVGVDISVDGQPLSTGALTRRNWNGQAEGVFEWAWDTTNAPGDHIVRVELDAQDAIQAGDEDPGNNVVEFPVTVMAAAARPDSEAEAAWVETEIGCCIIHVVSGTAAERDLPELSEALESAVLEASNRLSERPNKKLNVYFIDRVLGQGGFAGSDMVVSYVDRRYAGGGLRELLVHEAVHVIDQQFAPQRISFLAEGLAVWSSGGHYKAEELNNRSAALLALGKYIPLAELVNDFYPVQHEIGYLQAAGFVTYLIEQGGWSTFRAFYSDVTSEDGETLAGALDANLQRYYGKTLAQIETEWMAYLTSLPADPAAVSDLATTIRYYDVMRRYQQAYDPTAYFLNAWLPHPTAVREQGNPADLSRSPATELNITLELMLHTADVALRAGDYQRANVLLDSVARVIDSNGVFIDPLSINYLNIVRAAAQFDYELHDVDIRGETAYAIATQGPSTRLTSLNMELRGQEWVILSH